MARRGAPNEDLSNIEFETSEDVEVVPTFNSMVSGNWNIAAPVLIHEVIDNNFIAILICRAYAKNFCGQSMHMVSGVTNW